MRSRPPRWAYTQSRSAADGGPGCRGPPRLSRPNAALFASSTSFRPSQRARGARRAGHQHLLDLGPPNAGALRPAGTGVVGIQRTRSIALDRRHHRRPVGRTLGRSRDRGAHRRSIGPPHPGHHRATLVPEPAGQPAATRRLLLARVRDHRDAATILRRSRRTGRRPPQGGLGSRRCRSSAIGLLYAEGYFRQRLNADGWQEERFPRLDPHGLAITPTGVTGLASTSPTTSPGSTSGRSMSAASTCTCSTPLSTPTHPRSRAITNRLYGGDIEHRLRQEIVLGIGGVRALRAFGIDAQVFHSNEGHAGFISLERIRELVGSGLTFAEAIEVVRAGGVFTTHTPVPAGIDRFPRELMEKYFGTFAAECGVTIDRADGPRSAARRARRRPLQHGGARPAPCRSQQRRRPAARRRQPRDVPRRVARRGRRRGADRLDHQRRARPHLGSGGGRPTCSTARPAGVGRRRRDRRGRRRQAATDLACGQAARRRAAPNWSSFVRVAARRRRARSRTR